MGGEFQNLNGAADMDIIPRLTCRGQDGKRRGTHAAALIQRPGCGGCTELASNTGVMDPPVVGSFENNVGHFFCKDTFKGKPIIVMFRWDARNKDRPVWSQAFSSDNGKLGNGIGITSRSQSLNRSSLLASWFRIQDDEANLIWTPATAMPPSPTAAAHRFTDPARTSPAAKIPGKLVSSGPG